MAGTFAVIGDPIDHSLSPNMHSAAFRHLGMDCSYIAYRIMRGELAEGIDALKKIGISGFNVTIPHKVEMVRLLDHIDETCSITGAVNTVSNNGGSLTGYNTDMGGFLEPLERRRVDVKGMTVLLLGAGGAARAIVAGLASKKAGFVTVANRTPEKADELCTFAKRLGLGSDACGFDVSLKGYDMVVNSTPIGMNGEPSPIQLGDAGEGLVVYDIVYKPMNTDLIKRAKKGGHTVVFGYEMLLGQAVRAFEVWHAKKAPYDAMKRALLGGV
ncbi:MAG: shikimate dehydrogenase [Nitrosopumilus sp. H8]|nr:MAG: shikimate dehydrogenase [Nitrosopumilus sp. H13]RNJ78613.1 MAG: shikimate dehydrogenase [Nitrosopumilus sp. H8]